MDYEKYILKHFHYNPDGTITRDDRKNSRGCFDKDGYLVIKVKGKKFRAHRIVWLLNYNEFPKNEIDHINRIRTDNRIENLRDVPRIVNILNQTHKINSDTGVVGIYEDKTTKGLIAKYTFHFNGKTFRFRNLEDAINKRDELRRKYEYLSKTYGNYE